MPSWTPDLTGSPGPKYQAVADALTEAIRRGDLAAGDRIPPQRELAAALGIDLTTVTRGYEIARHRGLIVGKGRQGSFVRDAAKASISAALQVDNGMNTPPVPPGAVLQRAFSNALHTVLGTAGMSELQYQNAGGGQEPRRAGAVLLGRLGLQCKLAQTVVTSGGRMPCTQS
ncbi:GntR family transcriptional regulator [Novosphingobium sp. Gsoil 351]|uniref:GntR family transcriptional regulator n=1 Tax=Novosphingobium sp. Gsoil 351 TaxID=2675225 RepID=UPI0018A838F0